MNNYHLRTFFGAICTFACNFVFAACITNGGPATSPSSDFTINANGTVSHTATGLMWKQCQEGLSGANCAGSTSSHTWGAALTLAKNSTFAGYSDWRLPNRHELESLVEFNCTAPAINSTVFPNTSNTLATWTSTTALFSTVQAWSIDFNFGDANGSTKTTSQFVRLVRAGQDTDALKSPQTISITGAPSTINLNATGTVTATIQTSPNSGNSITFSSNTPSTCSVVSATGVVTGTGAGTCTIAANLAGSASYSSATTVTQNITINKLNQTLAFDTVTSPLIVGSTYTAHATSAAPNSGIAIVYSATPAATCTINSATGLINGLAVGVCAVTANQAGNANYNAAAPMSINIDVGKGNQSLSFAGAANTVAFASTLTVTATSASPNSGNSVTYGATPSGVCTINSSTGLITPVAVGDCTITANQAGNTNFNAAPQTTLVVSITKANQSLSFSVAPNGIPIGTSSTVTAVSATPNSGNAVTYGATPANVCTVNSAGLVNGLTAGTCTIAANQAGNTNYNAATQATVSFVVGTGSQSLSNFGPAPASLAVGSTVTVSATKSTPNSGNAVSYGSGSPSQCSVNAASGLVTALAVGTCSLTANLAGNANYSAAPQVTLSFPIVAANPIVGNTKPRYRLYYPADAYHLYTTDTNEYNIIPNFGWQQEGVKHKVWTDANGSYSGVVVAPYYRLFNRSTGEHHWTTDANEYSILPVVSNGGWVQEGIDGYVIPPSANASSVSGMVVLHRLYQPALGRHLWTVDNNEKNVLTTSMGWVYEGIGAYVIP